MQNVYPELGPPQIKTNLSAKKAQLAKMKKGVVEWKYTTAEILYRYQVCYFFFILNKNISKEFLERIVFANDLKVVVVILFCCDHVMVEYM